MTEANPKGTLVCKMRKNAIILYLITVTLLVIQFIYIIAVAGTVPDPTKDSFFIFISALLIYNLITDNKSKLAEIKPWYANKWGWLELLSFMALLISLSFWILFVL